MGPASLIETIRENIQTHKKAWILGACTFLLLLLAILFFTRTANQSTQSTPKNGGNTQDTSQNNPGGSTQSLSKKTIYFAKSFVTDELTPPTYEIYSAGEDGKNITKLATITEEIYPSSTSLHLEHLTL